jgi:cbb3-type cytochrome oxidase subunit 1
MDWFVKAFVKASVAWLAVGVVLGMSMAMVPAWTVYRAMHAHVMLLGFVTMFINGVAYHVVPRLSGRPLWSVRAAHWHWWLANAGLGVMVAGFWLRASGLPSGTGVLSAGGTITGIGVFIFLLQVWRTVDAPPPSREANPLVTMQSPLRRGG